MFLFKFLIGFFTLTSFVSSAFSEESRNVLDFLKSNENYTSFYKLIKKANYEELFISESKFKKVLYIPDNNAFDNLPANLKKYIWNSSDSSAAKKIIKTHLYAGSIKKVFKDPSKKVVIIERVEINNEKVRIYSNSDLFVKDMVGQENIILKDNIQIIPISCVMYLQSSYSDSRLSEEAKNNSLITSCCLLSDKEVSNFIKDDTI
jgi:uncharacterized surface protein with fasciclin (FAS1) repeats